MSSPLVKLMCLSAISVASGAARLSIPRFRGAALFCRAAICPVLGVTALAGLFLVGFVVHALSFIFLSKKSITNDCELFATIRNATFWGALWKI